MLFRLFFSQVICQSHTLIRLGSNKLVLSSQEYCANPEVQMLVIFEQEPHLKWPILVDIRVVNNSRSKNAFTFCSSRAKRLKVWRKMTLF